MPPRLLAGVNSRSTEIRNDIEVDDRLVCHTMITCCNDGWKKSGFTPSGTSGRLKLGMTGELDEGFKAKLLQVQGEVTRLLDANKVGLAAEYVYNEFWHWFCDESIENSKSGKISIELLKDGYKSFLIMLHPFVPFVTEAAWKEVFPQEDLLISSDWPVVI